ncbi:MAG: hypothetical protein HYX63_01405 [Gammaproteobacteria bacterium]|nr:hypothetical protein [Gammaproteobacteria bacterium]
MGNEFVVSLHMDGTMQNQLRINEQALVEAQAYAIDSADMAGLANDELRHIIQRKKQVKEWKTGFVAPAKLIISNAEKLFDPALEALENAEGHLKGLLKGWTELEDRRVADERRKADDEARRIRQEAEQKATAERARAEQQAADERRKAEAAEQERQRAEAEAARARAEGDKQAAAVAERQAAAAAAEAAKREESARAKEEEGEAKAVNAELSAMATIQAAPQVAVTAVPNGFGLRDNFVAIVEKDERTTILAIAAVLATRPELVALLKLDMSAANKMAKALRDNANLPGFVVRNERISTSRKAS